MSTMWHYGDPENGILDVTINQDDRPVNAFSREAMEELKSLLGHIRKTSTIQAVMFRSTKPGMFIAGADVNEIQSITNSETARQMSKEGQAVFQELEDLGKPTVALINGACLGGGLEFALACDYRVASDHAKTLLGLPEVKLGILPGWGGTVRLPRQIGFLAALPLILTGKTLNGYQARSRNLVHDVVPPEALPNVGRKILQTAINTDSPNAVKEKLFRKRGRSWFQKWLDNRKFVQNYALKKAEKQVRATTHGHYPAPLKIIEVLRVGQQSSEEGFREENQAIAELSVRPVTAECIRLFFLSEAAKKPPASLKETLSPNEIDQVAIIGAGAMGAGIALLYAKKDVWTRLKDLNEQMVGMGLKVIRKSVQSAVKRKRMSNRDVTSVWDHLSPTTDYTGLKNADVIIEAVVEEREIKRQVFADLSAAAGEKTVLATNTSSLTVAEIAEELPNPERVVGIHFFNPPDRMQLVEIIRTERTSPAALAKAVAAVQRLGKIMVIVGDCPGFLVNRLLTPYMNEAGYLLEDVDDPMEIDRVAVEFGMPMGPLALIDLVGVEVAAHVAENMHEAYGDRMKPAEIWNMLERLRVEKDQSERPSLLVGKKGKKKLNPALARDIRRARKEEQEEGTDPLKKEQIIERLIYPIINEGARCLSEGIAASADDIDIAMVFGTGFAPFLGGPMQYGKSLGFKSVLDSLEYWAKEHPRLRPSEAMRRLATGGEDLVKPPKDKSTEITSESKAVS